MSRLEVHRCVEAIGRHGRQFVPRIEAGTLRTFTAADAQTRQKYLAGSEPVEAGRRGSDVSLPPRIVLAEYPKALRTHPALGFYVKEAGKTRAKRVRTYPAMVAAVQGPDGQAVTRTART